ncbi:MAG: hypothetical protein AVDCRST_MAG87-3550, partial [uncultured Thermomicrobiales bacterium]
RRSGFRTGRTPASSRKAGFRPSSSVRARLRRPTPSTSRFPSRNWLAPPLSTGRLPSDSDQIG